MEKPESRPSSGCWHKKCSVIGASNTDEGNFAILKKGRMDKKMKNYYSHQYNNPHEQDGACSGSTFHSGQGGNTNYDVNKRLK
ncbi:MAG TPA: hypothetical protein DCL44_11115 [Elusimicrobia bacterium]|nr:hypothetical protein [Elusimicrobiota bacterium]